MEIITYDTLHGIRHQFLEMEPILSPNVNHLDDSVMGQVCIMQTFFF